MRHGFTAALALAVLTIPASAHTTLPHNRPLHLKHVAAVCTGIGADEEGDARWNAYPLKIVVAGKLGQYLAGADVTIAQHRRTIADLHCEAPVILVKLDPGRYRLTATRQGKTATTAAWVLNKGQGRAVLRFPNQGGAVSVAYMKSLREQAAANPPVPVKRTAHHPRRHQIASNHRAARIAARK